MNANDLRFLVSLSAIACGGDDVTGSGSTGAQSDATGEGSMATSSSASSTGDATGTTATSGVTTSLSDGTSSGPDDSGGSSSGVPTTTEGTAEDSTSASTSTSTTTSTGEATGSDSSSSTGTEADPCPSYGELLADCFYDGDPMVAEMNASACQMAIESAYEYTEACGMTYHEWIACLAGLDCDGLQTAPPLGPCAVEYGALMRDCV